MLVKAVLKVVLVDVNSRVVKAWKSAFSDTPEVEIVRGSILDQQVDAWVTPTNARGLMNGGVDAAIKEHLGPSIERRVKKEIANVFQGMMPVGRATCVPTGARIPRFLISTPTMVESSEDVSATVNEALACAAAFQAIHAQNRQQPGSIASVALPGLGAATGRVPVRVCANLMWTGYTLFGDYEYPDYTTLCAALLDQLGGVTEMAEDTRLRIQVPAPF
jgi:O-acetyl-ADP-ribose deacetylase (regulator of RNase III)